MTKFDLETALKADGFQKVAEGEAVDGKFTVEVDTDAIPPQGDTPIRVFPRDFYFELRVVDKAELSPECPPGREYVVFQRRRLQVSLHYIGVPDGDAPAGDIPIKNSYIKRDPKNLMCGSLEEGK